MMKTLKAPLYFGGLPIRFCDVFNGCERISEACDRCWAVGNVWRFSRNPKNNPRRKGLEWRYGGLVEEVDYDGKFYNEWTGETTYCPEELEKLIKVKRGRVYAFSWRGDWMYGGFTDEHIGRELRTMSMCKQHIFLTLTKRPERLSRIIEKQLFSVRNGYCDNIWYGTTACDQESLERNVPELLNVTGYKWLMLEPLLNHVNIPEVLFAQHYEKHTIHGTEYGVDNGINWVVVGAETGRNARPCNPEWIRSVVHQCRAAGVPVLDKSRTTTPLSIEYPEALEKFVG